MHMPSALSCPDTGLPVGMHMSSTHTITNSVGGMKFPPAQTFANA